MKNKILSISKIKKLLKNFLSEYKFQKVNNYSKEWSGENIKPNNITYYIRNALVSLIILCSLWVQVPQWDDDWSKCAIDIPDSSCHWYIKSPDNTFGEGFDWKNAPWFDVNGLNDISKIEKKTVLERLQKE